ncbi:ISAs1 family transposase [Thiorhodovibrio litoralis]|uniref:ISAs1 family transposase n=1 Tax=Thiorhodovibrio litoralis TaxID=2952932 RepID=UPI002B262462|nr:ISAs1 family transposase [Thiorhodovibrio litoralis]WPL10852.1 Transposase [Thiorhodovibrio litoralis]WPL11908.1 Transposase [Thiorhodovibrio litoralis]
MPSATALDHALTRHFAPLVDPRNPTQRRHILLEMIVIAIAAILGGAEGFAAIAQFGRSKEAWLRQFLDLPNGIPSHDTFGRVFSLIEPAAFQACFRSWAESIRELIPAEVVAIDGKTLRHSFDRARGLGALHMVSAWATANRMVLGQVATEAKSNEITAIPKLLELLCLRGCIVTIDAMGCQKAIAAQIIDQGGDYLLALKGNQGHLVEEVNEAFIEADARGYAGLVSEGVETRDSGHGRVETRRYRTLEDLSAVPHSEGWKGMNMIGMVQSERTCNGKITQETRYYIGSCGINADTFATAARGHWGIENAVHWCLDIGFREDESRLREPIARENFAVLRHLALTRLKKDSTHKLGIHNKRLTAGWNEKYLGKLLFEPPDPPRRKTMSGDSNISGP